LFYTVDDVRRFSRFFRGRPCEVSEELRGWMWGEPPLLYPYDFLLSVSDVAGGFCESGRIVYVRYVLRRREFPSFRLLRGSFIHAVYGEAIRAVKSLIYGGVSAGEFRDEFVEVGEKVYGRLMSKFSHVWDSRRIFDLLWRYAADVYSSCLLRARSISPYLTADSLASMVVPLITEYPVDGSLIGLSRAIRIDALLHPSIIVEVKTREIHPDYEIGLAGYALAFESLYEIPVNYAVLVKVDLNEKRGTVRFYERIIQISDELRTRFIEKRDMLARIVSEGIDPGRPSRCHRDCPYFKVCSELE